jgi:type I restriction enzyme R subunit
VQKPLRGRPQLCISTDNSHHRYDVILLVNGLPLVQIALKALGLSPRRAMEQIVDYKNDPGNGYNAARSGAF